MFFLSISSVVQKMSLIPIGCSIGMALNYFTFTSLVNFKRWLVREFTMKSMTRIVLLAAMASVSANALADSVEMDANAEIVSGLTLTQNTGINFGKFTKVGTDTSKVKAFTLSGDGSVVDAASGTAGGSSTYVSDAVAGVLQIEGVGNATITWKENSGSPAQAVTLAVGGGGSAEKEISVSNFKAYINSSTTEITAPITLVDGTPYLVAIGADIAIKDGQDVGVYAGKLNVYVNY